MKIVLRGLVALLTGIGLLASAQAALPSTAQPNVQVLAAPFTLPGLHRTRSVRLYLPPGYTQGEARYPVIYMHDGQNLFDDATAHAGEWGVDETLNELARRRGFEAIVVGIDDAGEQRMTELNPWDHPSFGHGDGQAYIEFIVGTLKPWIDAHYRTRPGADSTAIIGSDMGGLISQVAALRHPEVFGLVGALSPAYWTAPAVFDEAQQHPLPAGARVYLAMGDREGSNEIDLVHRMQALLARQPAAVTLNIEPSGMHNETSWHDEFRRAVLWLFKLPK
jgi:predicted alpha/beta superfamily hydrolase